MESELNKELLPSDERYVELLLERYKAERVRGYYNNWPLKDVPFEVLWNEFSHSNVKLRY